MTAVSDLRYSSNNFEMKGSSVATNESSSFLIRHEFLIRRLHSLSGLIPVGAYMVIHLMTNASVLNSPGTFQRAVYQIHSLGAALPVIEWGFIFLPILFHAIFGIVIIRGGLPNTSAYRYTSNTRYTLQRRTGVIAFLFIVFHVFHMHGWFHFEAWQTNIAEPLGGAMFRPYNAASSLAAAMAGFLYPVLYFIGLLACVYHLANGLWTMGITWGLWTTPAAQQRANWISIVFGVGLFAVSLGALVGAKTIDTKAALEVEDKMHDAKLESAELTAEETKHKRATNEERASWLDSANSKESSGRDEVSRSPESNVAQ